MKEKLIDQLESLVAWIKYLYATTGVLIGLRIIDLNKIEGLLDVIGLFVIVVFSMIFWLPFIIAVLVSKVL